MANISRVANIAGTQEPIYGPSAIQSVSKQAETIPFTELSKDQLKWTAMDSTCVETQTFYVFSENGHLAMAQLIYNNLAYVSRIMNRFHNTIANQM